LPIGATARVSFKASADEVVFAFHNFFTPTFFTQDFPRSILYSEFSARMYILHSAEINEIRLFLASR